MKSWKRQITEWIELQNREKNSERHEKSNFGNIGSGPHQTCGDKKKTKKKTRIPPENEEITRKQAALEKSDQRDKYLGWPHVIYLGPSLKLTREEPQQKD